MSTSAPNLNYSIPRDAFRNNQLSSTMECVVWCTWNENRCTYVELVGAQGPTTLSCDTEESEIPGLRDGIVVFQLCWRIIYFKVTGVSSVLNRFLGLTRLDSMDSN